MNNLLKYTGAIITGVIISTTAFANDFKLDDNNWTPQIKNRLEKLLKQNSNQHKKVIFDFDNTVVSRDIGEATLAYLVKDKVLDIEKIKHFSPTFMLDNKEVSVTNVSDLTEYYEKFMESTAHHTNDDISVMNGYVWLTQMMEGLSPLDIINETKKGYMSGAASKDRELGKVTKIDVTEGKTSYGVPFFHPETVDLIGNLLINNYDVYFVSASNVWTIRYMVTKELTKLIKEKFKKDLTIPPENVFGISTLIKDKRTGILYKDIQLVREKSSQARLYANLDENELKNYELTNQLVLPVTAFDDKTTNIMKYIVKEGEKPFLTAGDSLSDLSMLKFSENKLWFARLEKSDYQEKVVKLIKKTEADKWFIQPVLYKKNPGLVRNKAQAKLLVRDKNDLIKVESSINTLNIH